MIYNGTLNNHKIYVGSCTVYTILFVIFFIISISISSVFIYFHWYFKKVILILLISILALKPFIKHIDGKYQWILKIEHITFNDKINI